MSRKPKFKSPAIAKVELTKTTQERSPENRIPAHVMASLQASGEAAATRLNQLLTSKSFDTLRANEQAILIRLAFEYAYGKPENAPITSKTLSLSQDSNDAVSAALDRMGASINLPEYSKAGQQ